MSDGDKIRNELKQWLEGLLESKLGGGYYVVVSNTFAVRARECLEQKGFKVERSGDTKASKLLKVQHSQTMYYVSRVRDDA